jgi:hypothetical protein
MPYALIPDGYSLKKVTELQKKAVDAKRRHDDVVAILANPNTPVVIGGLVTAYFATGLAKDVIEKVEETVGPIAEDTKTAIQETIEIKVSRPAAIRKAIADFIGSLDFEGLDVRDLA